MSSRAARLARGAAAASIALFVAACSHALAGGALPNVAGLALVVVFSVLVSVLLTGKRMSLPRLIVSVALSQALFHGAFSLLGAAGGAGVAPTGGHAHSMAFVPTATAGAAADDAGMWLAHLVAAVVTVLALRFGERAFWGLFGLVDSALHVSRYRAAPASQPTDRLALAPAFDDLPRPLSVVLSALRHRGPPALSV
ncbi:hypothetical protein BH09ACT3_BH09ACT3_16310 [soil metagenome]